MANSHKEHTLQITLNQVEIETALKAYINDQINIKDGMEITIDLKAGRGPEGFSATIDISAPAKKAPVTVTEAVKPAKQAVAQATSTNAPATGTAKAAKAQPEPEPEEEQVQQEETAEQEAVAEEAQAEEATTEAEEVQAEEQPRKSLFGNLKKPVNN